MPTLYVEKVPNDLYKALRSRARRRRRSMAAEVLALLAEAIPTPKELKLRQALLRNLRRLQAKKSLRPGPFASTEEMQRQDRAR